MAGSAFSRGIGEALDAFFAESRQRLEEAIGVIGDAVGRAPAIEFLPTRLGDQRHTRLVDDQPELAAPGRPYDQPERH